MILGVLAGGSSRRFGRSKLDVRVDGMAILAWQLQQLSCVADGRCWLSLSGSQVHDPPEGSRGYQRWVADPVPGGGPLVGIWGLLRAAMRDDLVVVVAADMPVVSVDYLQRLVMRLREKGSKCAAVMGRWVGSDGQRGGDVEPLPSVWRGGPGGAGTTLVAQALAVGLGGPVQLAGRSQVGSVAITTNDAATFMNINRPADIPAVARQLGKSVRTPGQRGG